MLFPLHPYIFCDLDKTIFIGLLMYPFAIFFYISKWFPLKHIYSSYLLHHSEMIVPYFKVNLYLVIYMLNNVFVSLELIISFFLFTIVFY